MGRRPLAGALDPALEEKVRPIFNLGDFETACFAAMKTVEIEVRQAAGLSDSVIGVNLMRQAFKPDAGLPADTEADPGERVALMELFAGAIGAFKNPPSHRTVHFDDPVEAAEVVQPGRPAAASAPACGNPVPCTALAAGRRQASSLGRARVTAPSFRSAAFLATGLGGRRPGRGP